MANRNVVSGVQARDSRGDVGGAIPDGRTLQNATNHYTQTALSGDAAGTGGGASPDAAAANDTGLQNATNPAQSPREASPGTSLNRAAATAVPAAAPPGATPLVLDPRQRDAIELILVGKSDRAVAEAVKVHRVTVTKWRLYDPSFQAALNRRRQERWNGAEERVRALLTRAVKVFEKQLRSDDPDVCYRAARALVQMAGAGRFAPPPLPTDPGAVLDLFARNKHVERRSADPRTEAVNDRDRMMALRDLRGKRRMLEQQELGGT